MVTYNNACNYFQDTIGLLSNKFTTLMNMASLACSKIFMMTKDFFSSR